MAENSEESQETVEATNLVKKKNAKSIVWNYFGLKGDKNGNALKEHDDRPVCRTCNKSVLCKGGNTSNLLPTCAITTLHCLKKQAKGRELHPPCSMLLARLAVQDSGIKKLFRMLLREETVFLQIVRKHKNLMQRWLII